jgi:hypothetical protein
MRSRRASTYELRSAIDRLPHGTREAMLDGVRAEKIIVGAYVDRDGGVCPMLAAHRHGGRTDFLPFARTWDRYTMATGARRATGRELRVLTVHLEASLLADDHGDVDLGAAIAEHRALAARSRPERPGDPDRSRELRRRAGWSWLRPFRRLDDYERAVQRAQARREEGAGAAEDELALRR